MVEITVLSYSHLPSTKTCCVLTHCYICRSCSFARIKTAFIEFIYWRWKNSRKLFEYWKCKCAVNLHGVRCAQLRFLTYKYADDSTSTFQFFLLLQFLLFFRHMEILMNDSSENFLSFWIKVLLESAMRVNLEAEHKDDIYRGYWLTLSLMYLFWFVSKSSEMI